MFESSGAPASRRKSVRRSQWRSTYEIAEPKPEFGSTFFSAICVFNHTCSVFITGRLCCW
ncbi:MAG: hypothetical protein H6Q05_4198 [Acidobacteria bacterium]|nr:hypothetical protein [Acidobacteriota bacterium]